MTLPAQKIQMPAHPDGEAVSRPRRAAGTYTNVDNDALAVLMTTGTAYTRVLSALLSRSNYTRLSLRSLSMGDLMTLTGLGASAVEKQLRVLKAEGRCEVIAGRYTYGKPSGPRLSRLAPDKRGRYDRQEAAARRQASTDIPAEGHTCPDNRTDKYPDNYAFFDAEKVAQDDVFSSPEGSIEGSIYISTTTSTDTRAEEAPERDQAARTFAEAVAADAAVVVVGSASQDSEQHPPVGGAADAAGLTTAVPVQDFHDQDSEIQQKTTTDNESVPPAGAPPAPRSWPETPAASAAHPVPQALNRKLWADWVAAFTAVEDAGLSGVWTRWEAHVGGNASQQLAHAEQWATWIGAGLADALRIQVPETIADTSVRSPARHLAGAMSNRAEEARRAPQMPLAGALSGLKAPAPQVAQGEPVASGQRRRDPRGNIWTVDYVSDGLVWFCEPDAPENRRESQVAAWAKDGA